MVWPLISRLRPNGSILTGALILAGLVSTAAADVVTVGTAARYVRVRNNGTASRYLHIGEIEAFLFGVTPATGLDGANDVALATQGASFESRYGSLGHGTNEAVYDGAIQSSSATFSMNLGVGNEYVLDLGQTRDLGVVRVWQRADCCGERLQDFSVMLLAEDGSSALPGAQVAAESFPTQPPLNNYGWLDVSHVEVRPGGAGTLGTEVVDGANARFVRVTNNGSADRLLHIGEIEAFHTAATPTAGAMDNVRDLAWVKKGASFESQVGTGGHGSTDAVFDGQPQSSGNTWTRQAVGAEYVLDLGQTRNLDEVRVWQRVDCCGERLSDFTVSLLADNGSGAPGSEVASQVHAAQPPLNSFASLSFGSANQFTLRNRDKLLIDVDATAGASDRLSVGAAGDGQLVLEKGATLQVSVVAGTPAPGDAFDVIDAASVQGTFTHRDLPALAGNQFWNLSKLYATGEIKVSENVLEETGTAGRFIRVRNDGTANRLLHIGEIEAFAPGASPTNAPDNAHDLALASQGASYESSVGTGGHGVETAVYNGLLETGGATWTRQAVNAEYVLDLGQTRWLDALRVWQRNDGCCGERLSDFTVSLLADNGSGQPGAEIYRESVAGAVPLNSSVTVDLPTTLHVGGQDAIGTAFRGDTEGRFIRVRANGGTYREFHIGEIEAFLAGVVPTPGLDNTDDVALAGKGASYESSIGGGGHGLTSAVYNGVVDSSSNTWDRVGNGVEYVLDLGQTRALESIRVWQRADCCGNRLSDFTVSLLADDGSGNPGIEVYSESFAGEPAQGSFASFQVRPMFAIRGSQTLSLELDGSSATNDVFLVGPDGLGELVIEPGAKLEIQWLGGISTPEVEYDILDFGSVTGQFSAISLPALAPAQYWILDDLYTRGAIRVGVPEPATWVLLALGALTLLRVRRRRP